MADLTLTKVTACVGKAVHDRCYFYTTPGTANTGVSSYCQETYDGLECGAPAPKAGFYFTLGAYCIFILCLAAFAWVLNKRQSSEVGAYEAHFMGGKTFGYIVSFLTFFSTIYSGYTINGVPNEAAALGFYSVRWLTSAVMVFAGFLVFVPRMRRISVARKHTSPNDLVTDRYDNKILTIIVLVIFVINNWIYAVAQFFTLKNVLAAVAPAVNSDSATWGFAVLIFVAEIMGGFRAVAFSDAIQSCIMIFAMICIACIYQHDFSGMAGVVEANCKNVHTEFACNIPTAPGTCLALPTGCLYYSAPHLTLPPSGTEESNYALSPVDASSHYNYTGVRMFSFNLLFVAYALNPHWIQRIMTANSDAAVKKSLYLLSIAGFIVTLPGIVEGICAKAEFAFGLPSGTAGFGVIANDLMAQGGFRNVIGIFAVCASFAAIMSTTDSAVLTISNMATSDLCKNNFLPGLSSDKYANIAKLFSFVTISTSTAFALYYDDLYTDTDIYGQLISFQNTLLWNVVPVFFCAYYIEKTSAWALIFGTVSGLAVAIGLTAGIQFEATNYGSRLSNDDDLYLEGGVWGAMVNIGVTTLCTYILPTSFASSGPHFPDSVMSQFGGKRLSLAVVNKAMSKTVEPLFTKIGAAGFTAVIIAVNLCLPWYEDSYGGCKHGWNVITTTEKGLPVNPAQPNCDPASLVGGLPRWFVGCLVAFIISVPIEWAVVHQWKTQDEAPWCGSLTGALQDDDLVDEPVKSNDVEQALA